MASKSIFVFRNSDKQYLLVEPWSIWSGDSFGDFSDIRKTAVHMKERDARVAFKKLKVVLSNQNFGLTSETTRYREMKRDFEIFEVVIPEPR